MRNMKTLAAMATGSILLSAGFSGPVAAQDASCACVAPVGSVAAVGSVQGQVLVSQAAGFAPATQGSQLQQGGRVIVGPQSTAVVSLGASCSVTLTANMDAIISSVDGGLCLSVSNTLPAGETADAPIEGGGFTFGAPEYIFLGAVGATVAASAFDEDEAVSE